MQSYIQNLLLIILLFYEYLYFCYDLCRKICHYYDTNNEQDATTFSFINLFNSALRVSGDRFAHPQEHFWLYIQLLVQCTDTASDRCIVQKLYIVKKCSWGWATLSPETRRAELKRLIKEKVVASCYRCTKMSHGHTNIIGRHSW